MSQESWTLAQHGQMPIRRTRIRLPNTQNRNQGKIPTEAKHHQIYGKSQISTIQRSTSALHWVLELLSILHVQIGKTTHSVLPTTQNDGCQGQNSDHL